MRRLWYRGILQPGDRRLASQIKGAFGQAFQNCFEQRVRAVLVLVSGGYLVEALPKQHEQGVVYRGDAPLGDVAGDLLARPEPLVGLRQHTSPPSEVMRPRRRRPQGERRTSAVLWRLTSSPIEALLPKRAI